MLYKKVSKNGKSDLKMQLGRPNLIILTTKSGEKMTHKAELSESLEDYLEMILMLSEKEGHVH